MKIEFTEEKNKSIMQDLITSPLDVEAMMAVGYALAKQVPKPAVTDSRETNCPVCEEPLYSANQTYCDECGQRLK